MSATERTSLAKSATDQPTYVEYSGILRSRQTRIRQFQCCVCAILISILIMALVTTISYSVSDNNEPIDDEQVINSQLKLSMSDPTLNNEKSQPLNEKEWADALKAGQRAIDDRHLADASAISLSENSTSPNSRHRSAVKTSVYASELALAGVGELGATRYIEATRKTIKGGKSAIGTYFNGKWAPIGSCKEFNLINCNETDKYRTYDGSCNHSKNRGAAFTSYKRSIPPAYADGISAPRIAKSGKPLPSAREVSLRVHSPSPSTNPQFTVMLAVFGQFIDHDMTATAISLGKNSSSFACCNSTKQTHPECFPVILGPGDPAYDISGETCMEFVRSAPAIQCKIGPRQQLNQVTSFIDGSTIYGSDEATSMSLRGKKSGLLRMFETPDGRNLLPQSTDPHDGCNRKLESQRGRYCFQSGDARANENLHLTTMHVLWARQHNRIAEKLEELNPEWDDERLYQESRRIIGAQLQHITYREFLPIILGEETMKSKQLTLLSDGTYRNRGDNSTNVDPAIANNFAASAFRFAHTLLPGLMRVTDAENGTDSYVQLHKMLFNPYSLYDSKGVESAVLAATNNVIQRTSTHVTSQLTRHLFEDPLHDSVKMKTIEKNDTIRLPCGLDLVSLNIQRGRDHGLPGYTVWREYCGLTRPHSFLELRGIIDIDSLEEIQQLYENVDDIDLYTGALAEIKTQCDGLVGPTFTCLISDQFHRIQLGDRYWYENSDHPYPFTPKQLIELRKSSLAKLICDCSDGIERIQPQIMKSINADNPVTLCDDLSGPDFTAWKEN